MGRGFWGRGVVRYGCWGIGIGVFAWVAGVEGGRMFLEHQVIGVGGQRPKASPGLAGSVRSKRHPDGILCVPRHQKSCL